MNNMKTYSLLIILIGGLPASVHSYGANISVMTDRDPVSLHESFEMIFEADGSVDDDPDFSPLNGDFQVLSTGVSSNMSIVNGKISTTKQWRLSLMARRTGQLAIPSIAFGSDRSKPSSVTVIGAGSGGALQGKRSNREVFIEVKAVPDNPYVQAQVLYTIQLFRAVDTSNSVLSDPKVSAAQAVIERVGDDLTYDTQRLGKRFNVVERTFAVYPQTSGRISIDPVIFQAETTAGFSSFFSNPFGPQPRSIVIQSDPLILNVKALPGTFTGSQWLPAKGLELKQEWSQAQPRFKVGEPITRTLTMRARGLMASQLPELPRWSTTDFKQYPDQPVLADDKIRFGITGTRVEKTALIPSRPGEFVLPAIRIPWWNTDADNMEYAELPPQKIIVPEPVGNSTAADPVINPLPLAATDAGTGTAPAAKPVPETGAGNMVPVQQAPASGQWQWISLGLFVLWLATLMLWRWSARKRGAGETNQNKETHRKLGQRLRTACQSHDPRRARDALLQWARQNWPERRVLSISDVAGYSGAELAAQIRILNNALYGRHQQPWDGGPLWQAFTQQQKNRKQGYEEKSSKLEPLFRI